MIFLKKLDIESLKRENNSLVDETWKAYDSDVILKVKTKEDDGELFLLLEHQTKIDERMPLPLLEYDIATMRHDVDMVLEKLVNFAS